jgi:uncharacterized protein YqfB (UPF0267 family)
MKKGLLTVLLASLVLVGCQNYDDQFDDLNAQISALKSQVDGLASLSGQVNALSGTISGLQSGIAAATAAANAAGATASSNATAIAAATAAATAAGASADAATAAATAATTAATEAVAAGATNATAIAAATAAATAAGVSADAATAAAVAATTAASSAASATDLTALSASLTVLAADVAAVQASLATAATAAAVTAIQAEITAIDADLKDLLITSNVYATAVTINDAASMAAALALGNKVQLMNATVTINNGSTVADADIQTFVNRIKTMNASFIYNSGGATGSVPTFDEMVSAKAITLTPAGDISFKKLTGATTITIEDDYESKITSVDFGALKTVTAFKDDTTANKINLTNATNVDLASLTRHTSSKSDPFTIITKKGATVDISSLDDVSTLDKQEDLYLSLNGAASYTSTKQAGGEIILQNVATASVSGLYGTLEVLSGVETLTVVDGVRLDLDTATDLATATLDFALDYDPDLTTANALIAAGGYSDLYTADLDVNEIAFDDLETLTITGDLLDLYVDGTELVTLSIDATMHDLTITGATDLSTLTVAEGSKIGNIKLSGTTNLKVADFNHTTNLTDIDKTAQKSVTFEATSNTALEKLHSTGDNVDTLTITGNTNLAELDFTGLEDDGSETTPSPIVWVYDNDLTATKATDSKDGDTPVTDGKTTDLGAFDNGTSGMQTLQKYLDHVALTVATESYVTYDKVSTLSDEEDPDNVSTSLNVEPTGSGKLVTLAAANASTVLMMVPAVADTSVSNEVKATKGKRAFAATTNR